MRDGKIAAIGSTADIRALAGPNTRVIDLDGRTVIPGLIDSHIHAIRAGLTFTTEVHWIGARSLADALDRIRAAAEERAEGLLADRRRRLDRAAVRRRPPSDAGGDRRRRARPQRLCADPLCRDAAVARRRRGAGHRARITGSLRVSPSRTTRTASRPAGSAATTAPSATCSTCCRVRASPSRSPAPARSSARSTRSASPACSIPAATTCRSQEYRALFQVWRDRALTVRVAYSLCAPRRGHELEDLTAMTEAMPMGFGDDWLRFNGIGENVVWGMYNNDKPSEAQTASSSTRVLHWAAPRGLTATFHWHNERSVHHLLDVLERVNRETPVAPLRWSIAHLNDASPDSLKRDEGDGHRLADAERVLFPRRGVPRPARRRGGAAVAADRQRASPGPPGRRRHRRAPRDELQSVRVAAMDAGRQDRRRHADARARGNADARGGAPPLHAGQRVVLVRRRASAARSRRASSPTSRC